MAGHRERVRRALLVRVLHITTGNEVNVVEIDGDKLDDYYRLIGCDVVQAIYGYDWGGPDWTAYIDEDGKLADPPKPQNVTAEILARSCGWQSLPGDFLVGDVVFFGPVDEDGNNTDVPQQLVDLASTARQRALTAIARHKARNS